MYREVRARTPVPAMGDCVLAAACRSDPAACAGSLGEVGEWIDTQADAVPRPRQRPLGPENGALLARVTELLEPIEPLTDPRLRQTPGTRSSSSSFSRVASRYEYKLLVPLMRGRAEHSHLPACKQLDSDILTCIRVFYSPITLHECSLVTHSYTLSSAHRVLVL